VIPDTVSYLQQFTGMKPEEHYMFAVEDHDLIFFFGDLNYRIVEGVELEEVYDLLDRSQGVNLNDRNEILLEMDQLRREKEEGESSPPPSPDDLSREGLRGIPGGEDQFQADIPLPGRDRPLRPPARGQDEVPLVV
jgi:hypothetical protein